MQALATYPQQDVAPWPLRAVQIAAHLRRRQMVSYSALRYQLRDLEIWASFGKLWDTFFPDVTYSGYRYLLDLVADFMHLVDERLFPLDWRIMDDIYNNGGHVVDVINWGPVYDSWGVPFEVMRLQDLAVWAQPLVALTQPVDDWPLWWDDAGEVYPEDGLSWYENPERAVQLLEALEPPLDGMAVAYQCVMRTSGNYFLDQVGPMWRAEYEMDTSEFYWDEHDIRALAGDYAEVREDIDRLKGFAAWCANDPNSETIIAETFLRLEDSGGVGEQRSRGK